MSDIENNKTYGEIRKTDSIDKLASPFDELAYYIFNYFFRLFGFPINDSTTLIYTNIASDGLRNFSCSEKDLFFGFEGTEIFRYHANRELTEDESVLGKVVMDEFFKTSRNRFADKRVQNRYRSIIQAEKNYDLALQNGICRWISGFSNHRIDLLIQNLEKWSVKTYEGRHVSFGFVINYDKRAKANEDCDVIEFLKDDYSATLTDCITTVMEINENAKLIKYQSITENNIIGRAKLTPEVPYRFASVLSSYVRGKKNGLFLLNNGDIVLSKNKSIMFVKRNLRWLNMSYNSFLSAIKDRDSFDQELLPAVFGSILDVSFSHTGGIIAIIRDVSEFDDYIRKDKILAEFDDLRVLKSEEELCESFGYITEPLKKKLITKRRFIRQFTNGLRFDQIDRKLRSELIAMDGACIVDYDGNIISMGAIIKNDSGSTEGGRGAACEKLSKFGIAVKISTDGYIELFEDKKVVLSIK